MYNIHIILYHPTRKRLYLYIYVIFKINSTYKKVEKLLMGQYPFTRH